ncbi:hypothetical protein KVV02_001178 [Mortierella alpina]|uniref:Uncharacterized protein n=1 Tax=Mortierella alpina TaxID=64518 RepID=A0A9P7ZW25_MORAP|nr:hypothetical protein KVV02_001178 [Mortierella alpina]
MFEIVALDIDRIIGPRYQTESSPPAQGSMAGLQSTFPTALEPPTSSSSVGSSSSAPQTAPMSTNAPLTSASLSTKARQQVPPNVANALPLQLSDQERSDLLELTGTDPFVGTDGEPLKRPKDSVPMEWFFRMNQAKQSYKHFPTSSWTAGFALFSEEDLVHMLFSVKSTRPLLKHVLGGADTVKSFVDTVLTHTASAPTSSAARPTKTYDPTKINFARGSKTLTNVEVKFAKPENCPDCKRARVVGVDLGEQISFCATRIGPKKGELTTENEGQREIVYIRRSYLYKPTTAFRQEYQNRLQESGLDLVLSRMPSLNLGGVAQYIQYTAQHRDAIREFYHGR